MKASSMSEEQTEQELRRTNRALRALSQTNQALIHATDENALLETICRNIVEIAGYKLAWVGYAEHDEARSVRPVAQTGFEEGYLKTVHINWADTKRGRGPTGTAIRTGKAVIARDILKDPDFAPWRDRAIQHGYASSIALPLIPPPIPKQRGEGEEKKRGAGIGALNIYSGAPDAFDDNEVKLLTELADDLAYGIVALRTREALWESEQRYGQLFDASPDAIFLLDSDGHFLDVNEAALTRYGYTLEELSALTPRDLSVPDLQGKAAARIRRSLEEGGQFEWRHRRKDGIELPVEINTRPIVLNGRNCILANVRDITERKQAEEELKIINEELLAINRITTTITATTGVQGILENVLDQALSLTGLEGGTVCLVAPDDTLHLAAHRATSEATIQDLTTNMVKIGDRLCGECARDQKPLILPDREAVLKFATREATRGEDIRFHAAYPLLFGERCLGVLCVFTRTDKKPSERSLNLLETVSSQIALAVKNAQLYEETLQHAATLEGKVKDRTEALEKNQKALMNVVEDLNEKSEALRAANESLQELDRLKSVFLASMSHELRTPLNSIIGFTGIMLMGMAGELNDEQKKQLNLVKNSGRHLLGLINDVLDISKIEAGRMDAFPEEFLLDEVIQEVMAGVFVSAADKGLALVRDAPKGIVLFSDRRRLTQVLLNLLSNAVKFTEQGTIRITVQSTKVNDQPFVRITVTDLGLGIKPEEMNRLFFPFQQVDMSLTKKFEGTGLGLYLSKKLANLLGGDITVKSEYGKGSTFTVVLPVRIEN